MALNYPGPYQVRIGYDSTPTGFSTLAHVLQLNVALQSDPAPGTAFDSITAITSGAGTRALDLAVDDLVSLIQPFYHTSSNISTAELWKYEPNSFEASFVSSYDISVNGTSGVVGRAASQVIFTFRSTEGGIMKMSFAETGFAAGSTDFPPFAQASWTALANHIIGTTNVWLARDTSYPFVAKAVHPGNNEAIFKKRFRA